MHLYIKDSNNSTNLSKGRAWHVENMGLHYEDGWFMLEWSQYTWTKYINMTNWVYIQLAS